MVSLHLKKNSMENMGLIKASLQLVNTADEIKLDEGLIVKSAVKQLTEIFLIDTSAYMLCINGTMRNKLGLRHFGYERYELADGTKQQFETVAPVSVYFENRNTVCRALVLPGDTEPLLGIIPMKDMDVVLNPKLQTITVHPDHPDMPLKPLK